ncbi:hypothetical protein PAXRUDRAFT_237598 [Paxillus rubicundulus Ve08.2h10]|uniref:Uncharacterized protein n=1 Tax=Paxillus rubicundulus Ve08.2h10 TaxID=930991 RepID=A0A0D0E117_9AGAM|nr:hypothetical protein PAXRUDRAFT_237598 [Paxillus rubicundulus Ve08.2h10]
MKVWTTGHYSLIFGALPPARRRIRHRVSTSEVCRPSQLEQVTLAGGATNKSV